MGAVPSHLLVGVSQVEVEGRHPEAVPDEAGHVDVVPPEGRHRAGGPQEGRHQARRDQVGRAGTVLRVEPGQRHRRREAPDTGYWLLAIGWLLAIDSGYWLLTLAVHSRVSFVLCLF